VDFGFAPTEAERRQCLSYKQEVIGSAPIFCILWGMGLQGVVICLAHRKSAGFDFRMLHARRRTVTK